MPNQRLNLINLRFWCLWEQLRTAELQTKLSKENPHIPLSIEDAGGHPVLSSREGDQEEGWTFRAPALRGYPAFYTSSPSGSLYSAAPAN